MSTKQTKQTIVDGRWTVSEARHRGEMLGATVGEAVIPAWRLIADASQYDHPRGQMQAIAITISLRPGYSARDHLFDRTVQRVAEAVEGKLFASASAAQRAAEGHSHGDGDYSIHIADVDLPVEVPPELEEAAEAIRVPVRKREAIRKLRDRRKALASLIVARRGDGKYDLTTQEHLARMYCVMCVDGKCRWILPGWRQSSTYLPASGLCEPNRGYDTEADAETQRQTWLADFDAAIAAL